MSQEYNDNYDLSANLKLKNDFELNYSDQINFNNFNDIRICGAKFMTFEDAKTLKNFIRNYDLRSFKQNDHQTQSLMAEDYLENEIRKKPIQFHTNNNKIYSKLYLSSSDVKNDDFSTKSSSVNNYIDTDQFDNFNYLNNNQNNSIKIKEEFIDSSSQESNFTFMKNVKTNKENYENDSLNTNNKITQKYLNFENKKNIKTKKTHNKLRQEKEIRKRKYQRRVSKYSIQNIYDKNNSEDSCNSENDFIIPQIKSYENNKRKYRNNSFDLNKGLTFDKLSYQYEKLKINLYNRNINLPYLNNYYLKKYNIRQMYNLLIKTNKSTFETYSNFKKIELFNPKNSKSCGYTIDTINPLKSNENENLIKEEEINNNLKYEKSEKDSYSNTKNPNYFIIYCEKDNYDMDL